MATFMPRQFSVKHGQTVFIRGAVPDDAARILEIARAVLGEGDFTVTEPDELPATIEQEQEWIRQQAEPPGKLLLVAVLAGAIVGLLHFENGHRRRIAHRGALHLSVLKECRDFGIGRALIQSLIEWAQEQTLIEILALSVLANNDRGIALYRKLGFREEGRCIRAVKIGPDKYLDEMLMSRTVFE